MEILMISFFIRCRTYTEKMRAESEHLRIVNGLEGILKVNKNSKRFASRASQFILYDCFERKGGVNISGPFSNTCLAFGDRLPQRGAFFQMHSFS